MLQGVDADYYSYTLVANHQIYSNICLFLLEPRQFPNSSIFYQVFFSSVPISSSNRMFERDLHFASFVHCDCSITVALEANTLAQNTTLKHPHS